LSSSEEIREVYESDIARQTLQVWRKKGPAPFYAGVNAFMHVESLFGPKLDNGDSVIDWKRPEQFREESDDA
jgi:hypothetical protein